MFHYGLADELIKMAAYDRSRLPCSMVDGELGQITKTGSIREVIRRLGKTIKRNPKDLARIAKEMASGEGGQVAKGMIYGAGGYGALKGLPRKNPETKKREPFEGAGRGALKGMAMGVPLAILFRYPALKKALGIL